MKKTVFLLAIFSLQLSGSEENKTTGKKSTEYTYDFQTSEPASEKALAPFWAALKQSIERDPEIDQERAEKLTAEEAVPKKQAK